MKKVVSLLIAIATAVGVSTAAFAAADDISGYSGSTRLLSDPTVRMTYGASDKEVKLAKNELILVQNDSSNALITPETHLEPGTEYIFKIFYSDADQTRPIGDEAKTELTEHALGGGKLRLRGMKGTSVISSAKIVKRGSGRQATYRLELNTKENWGTKLTDVEYQLTVTGQTDEKPIDFAAGDFSFEVGYGRISENEIDNYGEDDIITISNDYPVILKKQFETIAKANNYKAIQFEAEDGMWSYLGRVSGMGDTNFKYTRDVVPAIVEKFEDQNFEFLTFGAGVTFPTNGEMRIDVSDFSDDFDTMYTYLYRNGKLTPVSTSYDSGADELVFRTNYLGSFIITDEQITDTTIIDTGNENNNENEGEGEEAGTGTNPENPNTGATGAVNAAVAMGIVSLAAAGAASRKRK